MRRARIQLDGERVGLLAERRDGSTAFTYAPDWLSSDQAVPISLTMPLRAEPYEHWTLHPVFANLLPEGWLLELSVAKLKVARDDLFGLLLATCRDCPGAIEVVPEGEP